VRLPGARASPRRWCQNSGCGRSAHGRSAARARNALCFECSRAERVLVHGIWQRFCQACKNVHPLDHFRGTKSSCESVLQRTRKARQRVRASPNRFHLPTGSDLSESELTSNESADTSDDGNRGNDDQIEQGDHPLLSLQGARNSINVSTVSTVDRAPVEADAGSNDMRSELAQGTTSTEQTTADEGNAIGTADMDQGPNQSNRAYSFMHFSNDNVSSAELEMQLPFAGEDPSSFLLDPLIHDDPNMI